MTQITYGSVCSGIEAASVAWEPLGWNPLWFSEIEPFPSAVLAYHWPHIPNLGDFTGIRHKLADGTVEAPDVLVGGTPCQAYSVAGLRKSLDDARGQLTLQFVGLANAIDDARSIRGRNPCTIVWENVPGVLSTKDNAFGCFLADLVGAEESLVPGACPDPGKSSAVWRWDGKSGKHVPSWPVRGVVSGPRRSLAWRVLDAQWFGVAQRRRRVFVVASAGAICPEKVLFEFDGVRRDSPPSRQQGQGTSTDAPESAETGSHWDGVSPHPSLTQSHNTGGIGQSNQELFSQGGSGLVGCGVDIYNGTETGQVAATCTKSMGTPGSSGPLPMVPTIQVEGFQGDIARTLQARHDSSPCADRGMDVVAIQGTTVGPADRSGPRGKGYDESGVQFTLTKTDIHAIAFEPGVASRLGGHCYYEVSGTLRKDAGDNQMAVAFQATDYASGAFEPVDQSSPITTSADRTRAAPIQVSGIPALAACVTSREGNRLDSESTTMLPVVTAGTLDKGIPGRGAGNFAGYLDHLLPSPMQVRRLTPTECARLQGFPDHHARIPWRGKSAEECPDGPQYKAYGNSMCTKVMFFIGKRLNSAILSQQQEPGEL